MKDDRLIYSKGYGFADEEENVPMDVMHVFRIASISKLITAVAIMKLQEEGKLTLQDRVFGPEGILNDTIFSDIKDPRTTKITVEIYYVIREDFLLPTVTPCFVRLRLPGNAGTSSCRSEYDDTIRAFPKIGIYSRFRSPLFQYRLRHLI